MSMTRKREIRRHSLLFTAAGWAVSLWIYLTAGDTPENGMIDEFVNSKRYLHEVEAYGGKANVLADQLWRWVAGLWQGRSLAFTVAALTVVGAAVYLFMVWPLPGETTRRGEP